MMRVIIWCGKIISIRRMGLIAVRYYYSLQTTFRLHDPFVLEHPQYYRLLHELHSERRVGLPRDISNISIVEEWWPSWGMQVLLRLYTLCRGKEWK
jgi:hypothetical protein